MPINHIFPMPGIIHEHWSGLIKTADVILATDAILNYILHHACAVYILIVETDHNSVPPSLLTLFDARKPLTKFNLRYFMVHSPGHLNAMLMIAGRVLAIPIDTFPDLPQAIQTAKQFIQNSAEE